MLIALNLQLQFQRLFRLVMDLGTDGLVLDKDESKTDLHPIFTKDPEDWVKLVSCKVEVKTEDGYTHVGYVYTVDPVSESIVLVRGVNGSEAMDSSPSLGMKLLMGTSVTGVNIISQGSDNIKQTFENLFRPSLDTQLDAEQLNARRQRLKSWLEKHRLPVTRGGSKNESLIVAGALTVQPPYTEDSCLSTNEIILSRIQGLIKSMPADHESWL